MQVEVKIRDFSVPNCVIVESGSNIPSPKQDSFKEQMSLPLDQIDEITLSELCNKYRQDVFKKAGKVDPKEVKLWAFLCENKKGEGDGIVAEFINGVWMPFVFSKKEKIDSLKPLAKKIAKQTNVKIKIVEFSAKEVIEII